MGKIDLGKIVDAHRGDKPKKPAVEWTVEASESVPTVAGREPVVVERTIRPDGEVRNIRVRRGNARVNFDIESAHVIAYAIKDLSRPYVPPSLTEEAILKEGQNVSEGEE